MYRKSATAQYAATIRNSKTSAGPIRHAPTEESTVNAAPKAVRKAPRCGNPNQIPAASTRPGCSTQKRAQDAIALSAPFCSIADEYCSGGQEPVQDRPSYPNQNKHGKPQPRCVANRDLGRGPERTGNQDGADASNLGGQKYRHPQKIQRQQRRQHSSGRLSTRARFNSEFLQQRSQCCGAAERRQHNPRDGKPNQKHDPAFGEAECTSVKNTLQGARDIRTGCCVPSRRRSAAVTGRLPM